MKHSKHLIAAVATSCLLCTASANASLLTWDFSVTVDTIYRDDANVIDNNIVTGSVLNGSFSYNSSLIEDSPTNDYVDTYLDPQGTINIAGLGIHNLSLSVSVVHQSSRDIVDVEGDFRSGNTWEGIEIGFLDYSQSYNNGELPINWHNPPIPFTNIEFEYYYDVGTDPCCYDSWLSGQITSISLRTPTQVPEPTSLAILGLGLLGLASRRLTK